MPVHTSEEQLAAERIAGNPVTPYLGGFAHWLGEQGYHPSTMRAKLRLLEELGGWLAGRRAQVRRRAEAEGSAPAAARRLRSRWAAAPANGASAALTRRR